MSEDAYARKEGFSTKLVIIVLFLAVIIIWFIFGYGYFTKSLPGNLGPQSIWLVYEDEHYSGTIGSYCWENKCAHADLQESTGGVGAVQGSLVGFLINNVVEPTGLTHLYLLLIALVN